MPNNGRQSLHPLGHNVSHENEHYPDKVNDNLMMTMLPLQIKPANISIK